MNKSADMREVWKRLHERFAPKANYADTLDHLENKYRHDGSWQDDEIANMMARDKFQCASAMQGCKL